MQLSQINALKKCFHYLFQAQCLIHIGGDAVKVAYVPFQLLPLPSQPAAKA